MKSIDFQADTKFKVGGYVRIPKYKNNLAKGYTPNWSEEAFVIKKVKNTPPSTCLIENLHEEEIVETLNKKRIAKEKSNSVEFRVETVIKKKK